MGSSSRYADFYDHEAEQRMLVKYAAAGKLQTLSPQELDARNAPVTIYPRPRKVRVWVRFGEQHARITASLCRTTSTAAGVEFRIRDETFRCWVWGNAVTVDDEA